MSSRRSTTGGGSGAHPRMTALVVAEVFPSKHSACAPLYPLVSGEAPMALLRVCDTPLIDYVLETLLLNGVDVTYVLLNPSSFDAVEHHLQTMRSSRGKSWCDCHEMKVIPVESTRVLTTLHDCTDEIIHQNLIPEDKSFVWAPLDCLSNISNLREVFLRHEARVAHVPKYAATMIACRDDVPLRAGLDAAVADQIEARRQQESLNDAAIPMTPITSQVFPGEFHAPVRASGGCNVSDLHRMLVAYDQRTMLVKQLHRCERTDPSSTAAADGTNGATAEGEDDALPSLTVAFSRSQRLSVRTDLVFPNFVIVAPGGLTLFAFHHHDAYEWLAGILEQQEIKDNSFGIDVCGANTICIPIHSVGGYLHVTWSIVNRMLHPLTRDANFADQRTHYSVSHESHTVYLHNCDARMPGGVRRASNVIVGAGTVVPACCNLRRSVLGSNVWIGAGCTINGCVIQDGVHIGDGCTLRDSVVCANASLGRGVELSNHCVIGREVRMSSTRGSLCVDGARIEACTDSSDSDPLLVGDKGKGKPCPPAQPPTIVPIETLFTSDAIPRDDDDEAETAALTPEQQFMHAIHDIVEVAIRSPSRIEGSEFELKHLRLSYGKTNGDLAKVVMQQLLTHAMRKVRDESDPVEQSKEAFHIAATLLSQWCRPFFAKFVATPYDMQQVLLGVCLTIQEPTCPLHIKAPKLLEWIYNGCDDSMYDEREYCIVSGPALLEFDDGVAELEEDDQETLDDEDRAVLRVGRLCIAFIDGVAKFLKQ